MSEAQPLHREEIKARLRMIHGSVVAFEQARGLPAKSVKDVLRGRASRATAEAIARELGVPLHVVSSIYRERTPSPKGDNSDLSREAHRLSAEAR